MVTEIIDIARPIHTKNQPCSRPIHTCCRSSDTATAPTPPPSPIPHTATSLRSLTQPLVPSSFPLFLASSPSSSPSSVVIFLPLLAASSSTRFLSQQRRRPNTSLSLFLASSPSSSSSRSLSQKQCRLAPSHSSVVVDPSARPFFQDKLSITQCTISVFKHYFEELEEESLRDNFVVVYELLDEIMDFGYPQYTEAKILSEFIKTDAYRMEVTQRPPMAVTNAVSWRSEGIHYKKNEVFLDVVESVNILVNSNGQIIRSDVVGALKMRTYLSGMLECKLGLNDRVLLEAQGRSTKGKAIDLDDIKFHHTATNVEINLPVPPNATKPNVRTSMGSASYAPESDSLVWKIKSFPGGK
ncbi:hypothetical protein ACS0TY_024504 [Phlomoides rotata]